MVGGGRTLELALVISGASGSRLAARFAVMALRSGRVGPLHVVVTAAASLVLGRELGSPWASPEGFRDCLEVEPELRSRVRPWAENDLLAPIASGSHPLDGVVVLPCSAGMAGSVAHGLSRGLGQRVADVALKQRWPLVLGVRESPMSEILLESLLRLARAGAHVAPPVPAFYVEADGHDGLGRLVDHYCVRLLDLLGIELEAADLRWRG